MVEQTADRKPDPLGQNGWNWADLIPNPLLKRTFYALYSKKHALPSGKFVDVMFGMANFSWYGFVSCSMTIKKWSLLFFGNGNVRKWVFMFTFLPQFFFEPKTKHEILNGSIQLGS